MDSNPMQQPATLIATKHSPAYKGAMITGAQIRAARALLGITTQELADKSGIHYATISRAEQSEGVPSIRATTLATLQSSLERLGVVFLASGDMREGGNGVRLRG